MRHDPASADVVIMLRSLKMYGMAEGHLVAPWPESQAISKTFSLILPEPVRLSDGPIQAFADWLLSEAHGQHHLSSSN